MKTLFKAVHCLECGNDTEADLFATRCPACGGVWREARYDCAALPADWPALLAERPANMWRYRELLPFPEGFQFVTMNEGWPPLLRAEGLERELGHGGLLRQAQDDTLSPSKGGIWIKDERRHPTGSFKDRQAAFTVSALKAQGVDELVLASTGNAAAAYAAYCARAGIKLWVFLTSSVPAEKMRELALYGAEVIKITGTYDQAKEIAADFAARRGVTHDKGAKAIPGKESMKTIALEIVEQMGWQAPDWYVQAVSGGIGPLGVLKGFIDLMLPDIDGERLLETLRANDETRDIPVMVVSAKDMDPTLRAQLAAQTDSVWTKGALDRSSLLAHVETLLPE